MRDIVIAGLSVGALLCLTDGGNAQSNTKALPKVAEPLFQSIEGLTTVVGKSLDTSRSLARAETMRYAAYQAILANSITLDPKNLLCDARADYVIASANRAYLLQVSGTVKSAASVEIAGLWAAFGSFFENVQINDLPKIDASKLKEKAVGACREDFDLSSKVYFGLQPVPKAGLIEAGLSLWNLITGLIKSAVVTTAQVASEERRRKVIIEFLQKDPGRRIEKTAENLAKELQQRLASDRYAAAAVYRNAADKFAVVVNKTVKDANNGVCKDVKGSNDPLAHADLWPCWRTAWDKDVNAAAKDLLEAANGYDTSADLGFASTTQTVSAIKDALEAIRKNQDEKSLDRFFAIANQLLGLAQECEKVFTKENREKVSAGIDAVLSQIRN